MAYENPNGPGTANGTDSDKNPIVNNISAGTAGEGFVSDDTSSATAKSTAEFTVEDGFLTLDAVPDLNFGKTEREVLKTDKVLHLDTENPFAVSKASTYDAYDGTTSSEKGKIVVSDYRTTHAGWTLTAKLGKFTGSNDSSITSATLNLVLSTTSASIAAGEDYTTVIADKVESDSAKEYSVASGESGTSLTLGAGSKLEKGTYYAELNWQLVNSIATPDAGIEK
ncbi:WxL domain-containing protein [Enterococcus songbeiensis]|uniref:WxL domain-containing protein n=1 Tax=Enterococcus songbeiensis TaxID=2559927 RepID=UPI00148507DF|nr:WxL domain-containing protein [Enterococcus songbeiensis]